MKGLIRGYMNNNNSNKDDEKIELRLHGWFLYTFLVGIFDGLMRGKKRWGEEKRKGKREKRFVCTRKGKRTMMLGRVITIPETNHDSQCNCNCNCNRMIAIKFKGNKLACCCCSSAGRKTLSFWNFSEPGRISGGTADVKKDKQEWNDLKIDHFFLLFFIVLFFILDKRRLIEKYMDKTKENAR